LNKKHSFVIYRLDNFSKVVVDYASGNKESFADFLSHFSNEEPRMGVIDFKFRNKRGIIVNRYVYISFSNE
jgi:hypothetical protein